MTRRSRISVAIIASIVVSSVVVFFVVSEVKSALYVDSDEAMIIRDLRAGRYGWLMDGCPEPPDAERYLGDSPSTTNYVYRAALVVSNRTYHGLFAWRNYGSTDTYGKSTGTYVITTTGEVLVIDNLGKVRLLQNGPRS